ncbi:MAG: hypothetical protein KGL90_05680 [Burkholderiales bacterium]|nr:hypothetical protein [Burkholderiales bacterium]
MIRGLPLLVALLLSACASLLGPRTVEISREEMQQKLALPFPMHTRLTELFEMEAAAPRLALFPQTNRVGAQFDLSATSRLLGRHYQGLIGLSFGLRYEAQDQTIRLNDVKVDTVQTGALDSLGGLPGVSRLGTWLAEEGLQNYPIHRFKPEDLRTADRLGYQVQDIQVTSRGLLIKLSPKP